MKRVLVEGIFILIFSMMITLVYNAVSPSGLILLKKAFRIKADAGEVLTAKNIFYKRPYLP